MITRIWQAIKEWINKMFNSTNIRQAVGTDIAISQPMQQALADWTSYYENAASWLIPGKVFSLNLAAAIASEIARAATIEMKVKVTGVMPEKLVAPPPAPADPAKQGGSLPPPPVPAPVILPLASPRADYLALQLAPVLAKMRQQIEVGCAKGGLMMKPYPSGGDIAVDFVQADQFYPISFDANGNITAAVFCDQRQVKDTFLTRLETHIMGEYPDRGGVMGPGCLIRNQAFRSTNPSDLGYPIPLAEVEAWRDLLPEAIIAKVKRPLFAYFRFPSANNVDRASPLGVSCFARAVGQIREADEQWSRLLWEFESGERALYADPAAFDKDAAGKPVLPHKRLYRTLERQTEVGGKGQLFDAWSPDLREQSFLNGLDAILRRVEFNCGLSYGVLSNPAAVEKTATEMIASKQRYYVTVSDAQKALRSALDQLLYAMNAWATLNTLAPEGEFVVTYDFDDSIVVDKDVQLIQDRQTVSMGAMPKYVYLMRNYNLDEATAKAWVADNLAEQPPATGGLFGGM